MQIDAPMSRAERGGRKRTSAGGGEASAEAGAGAFGLRDFLTPYVLLAISAQRAHGYLIEQYLRGLGLAQVEMSTLYRTLRQLEKQGLVTSAWEAGPGGPARRVYALTDAGQTWLRAGAGALAAYRSAIDAFFGKYKGTTSSPRRADRPAVPAARGPRPAGRGRARRPERGVPPSEGRNRVGVKKRGASR
jgi:poly-beta-hydroxybutyrate-responsive repressor